MKKAFTLIELLVVVLIIGILAAIALPMYEKAVIKSRFAEAFTNLKTLADAVKVCEMENGVVVWPDNTTCAKFSNLSVDIGKIMEGTKDAASSTDNFAYTVDRGGLNGHDTIAVAQYSKADACLCIYDDGSFVGGSGEGDCREPAFDYDINKLLGLSNSEKICNCC